jgi:quercetin dioxygenase-like cupin family protein
VDAAGEELAMSVAPGGEYWLGEDEGRALWMLGGRYTFKARGANNGNEYTLVEVAGPDGFAIPVHLHEHENEGFYVARGEIGFVVGDRTITAAPGSFVFAPRGVHHAFRLQSPEARLLLLITPGAAGHEDMFEEMGEPAPAKAPPARSDAPPDAELLGAIALKHGTRIVGPPPEHVV